MAFKIFANSPSTVASCRRSRSPSGWRSRERAQLSRPMSRGLPEKLDAESAIARSVRLSPLIMWTLSRFGVYMNMTMLRPFRQMLGLKWVVLFLCAWVLAQMLGMPSDLFSLVASSDMFTGSVYEEFSLLPSVPEPRTPTRYLIHTDFQPSLRPPILVSSVFH